MSGKATGRVWDMPLRQILKFVLLAYADHADHEGNNVFPSIALIAKKTGYSPRQVQRLTRQLEDIGCLVDDGSGPKGQRKWRLGDPKGGDKALSGVTSDGGDTAGMGGGDKNGDDLSKIGVEMSPELNSRTEQEDRRIQNKDHPAFKALQSAAAVIWPLNESYWAFDLRPALLKARLSFENGEIIAAGMGIRAELYQDRYAKTFERALIGILDESVRVTFMEE